MPQLIVLGVVTALALTGCSRTVSLQPAANANDPLCAELMVRLTDELGGQQRHWTDAQSTAAWGDPASVIMRCGVAPPGPSTLPCITLGGTDWLVDGTADPDFRVTTYGREPAVEVLVNTRAVSSNDVLTKLGGTIANQLPAIGACTDPEKPPAN